MNRILISLCFLCFAAACEPSWADLEANARCRQLTGQDCDAGTGGGGTVTGGGVGGGAGGGGISGGGAGGGAGGGTGGGSGGGTGGGLTGGGTGGGLTGGGTGGGLTGGGTGGGLTGGGTGGGLTGGGTGGGGGTTTLGGGTGGSGGGTTGGGTGGGGAMASDGGCVHDGGVLWSKFFALTPNGSALRVAGYDDRLYWTEALPDGGTRLSMSQPLDCSAPTAQFSVDIEGPITMLSAGDAGVMAASVVLGRKYTRTLQGGGGYSPGSPTRAATTGPTESATLNGQVGSTLSAIGLSNNANLNVAYGSNCQFDTSPGGSAIVSLGTTQIAAIYSTFDRCIVDSSATYVDAGVIFTVSRSATPGPSAYLGPVRGVGTFAPAMVNTATGVFVAAQTNMGLMLYNIDPNVGPLIPQTVQLSAAPVFARALFELPPNRLVLVGEFTGNVDFNPSGSIASSSGTQVYKAVLQQSGQTMSVRPVTNSSFGSSFVYGATIVGNQLVMALSCAGPTPPCTGVGVMLISIAPD